MVVIFFFVNYFTIEQHTMLKTNLLAFQLYENNICGSTTFWVISNVLPLPPKSKI